MRNLAVVLMLVLLVSLACSPPVEQPPVTPEVDVEQAENAANQLRDTWDAAFNSRDLEALIALYLDDAVRMQPDEPAWVGRAQIRECFEKTWEQLAPLEVTNEVKDVVVSGDYVIVRGTGRAVLVPEEGGEKTESFAKYVSVQQLQPDGSTRVVWDIWNRDAPLPMGQSD